MPFSLQRALACSDSMADNAAISAGAENGDGTTRPAPAAATWTM
jgi:hypothetical protein